MVEGLMKFKGGGIIGDNKKNLIEDFVLIIFLRVTFAPHFCFNL